MEIHTAVTRNPYLVLLRDEALFSSRINSQFGLLNWVQNTRHQNGSEATMWFERMVSCSYESMNLTFLACSVDGLQRVHSPIKIVGGGTVSGSGNQMSCPKCGAMSRLLDFTFEADTFGKEAIDFLITPDVMDKLNELRNLAQRISFQELNSIYEFYSKNHEAIAKAPPTIKRLFAALKSKNATTIITYAGLLIAILQITGVIGSPDLSAEEIVEIVREYDATHPDSIQQSYIAPNHGIAPEMVDPPETLYS